MKLGLYLLALTACYVLFFEFIFLTYGNLPAQVATEFDFMGRTSGWMSRGGFVALNLALGILLPPFLIWWLAGRGRVPAKFVKPPNRDYWLAPERYRAAFAILIRFALLLACLMVLFLTGLYGLVMQTNAAPGGPHLNLARVALLTGLLLAGMFFWDTALKRRFAYRP
jgi:hypothetical protein